MAIDNAEYISTSKTSKRDELGQGSLKSKLRDRVFPSFLKGKNDRSLQATTVDTLKIGQRVVTFVQDNDNPVRGTVRFIGEEKDASGQVLVGLELVGNSQNNVFHTVCLRTFAPIVTAHPYSTRKFTCHVMHRACMLSTKMNNDRADGHSFAWI